MFIARTAELMKGFANYGNPIGIALQRMFRRDGEMTIVDRRTGVSLQALRRSYHMFGETWYTHDYDVAGCPIRKDDVVLDIGANQGFFTCYAAHQGAQIYAFEPHPKSFERLMGNIARNGYASRVTAECMAIGDFEGETNLFCSSHLDGGADTINPQHAAAVTRLGNNQRELPVRVARLSSVIPADLNVRLLKMDCEGAELAILKDLANPAQFDSMAIEFHPDAYPVETLIQTLMAYGTHQVYAVHGYIVHAIRNDVLIDYAKRLNPHVPANNGLMP
jgi:FkbM family methyltransferase